MMRVFATALLAVAAWSLPPATDARELAAPVDEMVEVEIASIGTALFGGTPVVMLREPGSGEVIAIFIGVNEAHAILRGMGGIRMPRPLSHELLGSVINGLDGRLERVYIDDLVDNTFLGMLEIHVEGGDGPVMIDSRPSDALALALQTGATIHVAPRVLAAARNIEFVGRDDQIVTALGITVNPVTDDLRQALGLPDDPGVVVSNVVGAAAEAGMEPGALVVGVNGAAPGSPLEFLELVRQTPADSEAAIRYWQAGERYAIDLPTDVPVPPQRQRRPSERGIEL